MFPRCETFRLYGRGEAGVCCDANGVGLGPLRLVERAEKSYFVRPVEDIIQMLEAAYGPLPGAVAEDLALKIIGIARSLNGGNMTQAMLKTLYLRLPEIPAENMAKMGRVVIAPERAAAEDAASKLGDALSKALQLSLSTSGKAVAEKYNHNHDERGRFSSGPGGGSAGGAAGKRPVSPPVKVPPGVEEMVVTGRHDPVPVGMEEMVVTAPSPHAVPMNIGKTLGKDVAKLIAKSPTLMAHLKILKEANWSVKVGKAGEGTFKDPNNPAIIIDPANLNNPNYVTAAIAHEVGHATNNLVEDFSSRDAYINSHLADEGAAAIENIRIQREIIKNGGPDIGIAGGKGQEKYFNRVYDNFINGGNRDIARSKIGQKFRRQKKSGKGGQTYEEYYGKWYDDHIKH